MEIKDNTSMFMDEPLFDNASQFIDGQANKKDYSLAVTNYMTKLTNAINEVSSRNDDVDWDKVIYYSSKIEMMAECVKNNDIQSLRTLSSEEIEIRPDYSVENSRKFI